MVSGTDYTTGPVALGLVPTAIVFVTATRFGLSGGALYALSLIVWAIAAGMGIKATIHAAEKASEDQTRR